MVNLEASVEIFLESLYLSSCTLSYTFLTALFAFSSSIWSHTSSTATIQFKRWRFQIPRHLEWQRSQGQVRCQWQWEERGEPPLQWAGPFSREQQISSFWEGIFQQWICVQDKDGSEWKVRVDDIHTEHSGIALQFWSLPRSKTA